MNSIMMDNNPINNQIDQSQILRKIQKNNEQIIQMIQQIFKVQMMNNMLLNQILNNNNLNNINNVMFNNMMNQINNFMNNMNIVNNPNIQINNNENYIDPLPGYTGRRINIRFNLIDGRLITMIAPENISIKESIEKFWKKSGITDPDAQKKIIFLKNACALDRYDISPLDKNKEDAIFIFVTGSYFN